MECVALVQGWVLNGLGFCLQSGGILGSLCSASKSVFFLFKGEQFFDPFSFVMSFQGAAVPICGQLLLHDLFSATYLFCILKQGVTLSLAVLDPSAVRSSLFLPESQSFATLPVLSQLWLILCWFLFIFICLIGQMNLRGKIITGKLCMVLN